MTTFLEFLEELEKSHQTVVLPREQVERLAARFGGQVRSMGYWNKSGDGSVEIPMSNVTEAAKTLDNRQLAEAVAQLKSAEEFATVLGMSSAVGQLIEALSGLYLRQFEDRVERFQASTDPNETEHLRAQISRELFGS
jgi:DNA-binding MurR/RpiR family transcriptional regulator